jgi:uncharacterized membrane protein YfcA
MSSNPSLVAAAPETRAGPQLALQHDGNKSSPLRRRHCATSLAALHNQALAAVESPQPEAETRMDMSLLGDVAPLTALLLLVAAFGASFVGGLSGFGTGLIIALFITPIVGAKSVIPVLSVFMTFTNGSRVWFFRNGLDWRPVVLIAGPAIPASVLGAMLQVRIESQAMQILLGLILILAVPVRRWLEGRKVAPGYTALMLFGAAFGFSSSLILGTGMLIIPMLLGTGLAGGALLATDAAIALIVNLARAIAFGRLDALTMPLVTLAVAMGVMTIPGTWAARYIVQRTPIRIHTLAIEALIIVGGASMIIGALRS